MDDLVSFKDYIEEILRAERDLIDERFKERDKAIVLFSTEMSRRLENLNHSHEKALVFQSTYVPREIYTRAHEDLTRRLEILDTELKKSILTMHNYVTRELYDRTVDEWIHWRSNVDQSLARSAERKSVYASTIVSALAFLGVVINIILRLSGH